MAPLDFLRRAFQRRTFTSSQGRVFAMGLVMTVCVSTLLLLLYATSRPTHEPVLNRQPGQHPLMGRLVEPQRNRVHKDGQQEYLARSPYSFSQHPGEEFGALVSFLSENSNKMLPVTLDPHAYLDPDVVLSIDTRKAGSEAAVAHLVTQVWVRNPVVLFLETDVPQSHEMKAMLYHIGIVKKQLMFDVNKRADARVLRAVLKRLTWGRATPFALIGGRPFTMDELRMEKQQGTLASLLKTAAGKA